MGRVGKGLQLHQFPPCFNRTQEHTQSQSYSKITKPKKLPNPTYLYPKNPHFSNLGFWAEKAYPKCLFWVPFRFLSIILSFRFSYREYGVLGLALLCLYVICGFPHMRALLMFCTPHENFEFGDLTQGNAPLIQRYPPTHRFPIGVYAASFRAVLTIDRTAAGDWD